LTAGLQGRVALVTGAGSGIGRAIALALAGSGASVAAADLNEASAAATVRQLEEGGARAMALAGDVADRSAAAAWVAAAARELGRVDILVNSAGLQYVAPVAEYPEDRWDQLIGVLLTGPFLTTRCALPGMVSAGWGRIVNIASAHGLVASRFKCAYVAAKHGLVGFTKVVALETAGTGVTANAVCPGYVRTPLVEGQLAGLGREMGVPAEQVLAERILTGVPLGRLLEPEEVAQAVLYLCSDAAAGMTGAALTLDGGWTAQ
jgi:3-hydroxybutyrate dehydrogenase